MLVVTDAHTALSVNIARKQEALPAQKKKKKKKLQSYFLSVSGAANHMQISSPHKWVAHRDGEGLRKLETCDVRRARKRDIDTASKERRRKREREREGGGQGNAR